MGIMRQDVFFCSILVVFALAFSPKWGWKFWCITRPKTLLNILSILIENVRERAKNTYAFRGEGGQ
jgi:hypothetical protein